VALAYDRDTGNYDLIDPRRRAVRQKCNRKNSERDGNLILGVLQKREPKMTEKRGRGQPKFEPTHDQRLIVRLRDRAAARGHCLGDGRHLAVEH
jgi:hypothetical protein